MTFADGLWGYVFLFLAGFCATQPWRYLGVFLSRDLDMDSEVLVWVRLVSTALIAGLVTRMIVFPAGELAAVDLSLRVAAFGIGIAAFFAARRNLGAGIFTGVAVLILAEYALSG